jgi:hypothetical protein
MIDHQETFGQALRRLMNERGIESLRDLEKRVPFSKSKLQRMSQPGATVSDEEAGILDDALHSDITLLTAVRLDRQITGATVLLGPNRYTDLALTAGGVAGQGVSDVDRRGLLMAAGALAPALLLEVTRLGLVESLNTRASASAADWEETVAELGYEYMVRPPHELLPTLLVDMTTIQFAVNGEPENSPRARDLRRCAAYLAALTAMTVANLGQLGEVRRWWRTARNFADGSKDPSVRAWVRGREIVRAMYEKRPIEFVITLADTYEAQLAGVPRAALPEFLGGRAQALAIAGRTQEASDALPQFVDVCENLPAHATRNAGSVFGWSLDRQMFTTSFVHSFAGNYKEAATAQDAAVLLYPSTYVRGPAQIELQRAVCLARMGDSAGAARHAQGQLERLSAADQIRPIVDLAHRVNGFIPTTDSGLPEVANFREYLAATRQIEAV